MLSAIGQSRSITSASVVVFSGSAGPGGLRVAGDCLRVLSDIRLRKIKMQFKIIAGVLLFLAQTMAIPNPLPVRMIVRYLS